jgi:hypothetical protein
VLTVNFGRKKQTVYQTVPQASDTPDSRSLKPRLDRGEGRAQKSRSKKVVGLFGIYSRSLLTMLDRGEARALSFSHERQRQWLYLPLNNHHASIPAQGIAHCRKQVQITFTMLSSQYCIIQVLLIKVRICSRKKRITTY